MRRFIVFDLNIRFGILNKTSLTELKLLKICSALQAYKLNNQALQNKRKTEN